MSTLEERNAARRRNMVANLAHSPEEAEAWDLEFWQQAGPEVRLSTLVAIHQDVAVAQAARHRRDGDGPDR
ncbi:MAG: hypothetical protein PVG53_00205 [Holophagae bacterium]|jgi:hypothetical protein